MTIWMWTLYAMLWSSRIFVAWFRARRLRWVVPVPPWSVWVNIGKATFVLHSCTVRGGQNCSRHGGGGVFYALTYGRLPGTAKGGGGGAKANWSIRIFHA